MTTFPLKDRFWLHVGPRPPENLEWLARRAGGLVAEPRSNGAVQERISDLGVPVILQHRGVAETAQGSLVDPDHFWIMAQNDAAVLTSRALWLPPSDRPEECLLEVVKVLRDFCAKAERLDSDRHRMAVIAVAQRWLTRPAARQALLSALESIGAPIGLMVGKHMDPLDDARAVEGIVEVAQRISDVALLRCDHGALGGYAFGAIGGSIGVGTSTRHYVPIGERSYKDLGDPTPRLLVPSLLQWWKGSKLAYYEGDPLFNCVPCAICEGASLARFQDESLKMEAAAHSVEVWSAIGEQLVASEPDRRPDAWIGLCKRAYDRLAELEDRHGRLHPASKQLKAWLRFAGVPAV